MSTSPAVANQNLAVKITYHEQRLRVIEEKCRFMHAQLENLLTTHRQKDLKQFIDTLPYDHQA